MPKTKLTLSVDARVIERAKRFSKRNETTVSRLVSQFLASLEDEEAPAAPITSRLLGVLPSEVRVEEHREHLLKKHS